MYTYPFFHENRSYPLADIVERQTGMHRSSNHNRYKGLLSEEPHLGLFGKNNLPDRLQCMAHQSSACRPQILIFRLVNRPE
jgi:hypothetical protein